MRPLIAVHGGAWNIPDWALELHKVGVGEACMQGFHLLLEGRSALDAVETAISHMESDLVFDAGKGSFPNRDGDIETDALIMDGSTLRAGSVAAARNILSAISLARKVMEETDHILLVAEGAVRFARSVGIRQQLIKDLLTEEELLKQRKLLEHWGGTMRSFFERHETVGAVAIDRRGNVAAGTSTGGTPSKLPGRVGDSPLIGCGAYADNSSGGVSATGWGESIMRVVLAKMVCDMMGAGNSAQQACDLSITKLYAKVKGLAGVIAVDSKGEFGVSYNTAKMPRAVMWEGLPEPLIDV